MWINLEPEELKLVRNSLDVAGTTVPSFRPKAGKLLSKLAEIEGYACPESDPIFIARAREMYVSDEIEIDDEPALSYADDGVWVGGWLWVSNSAVDACEECGAIPGTSEYGTEGDGYNGLCPSCADEAEADDDEDDD